MGTPPTLHFAAVRATGFGCALDCLWWPPFSARGSCARAFTFILLTLSRGPLWGDTRHLFCPYFDLSICVSSSRVQLFSPGLWWDRHLGALWLCPPRGTWGFPAILTPQKPRASHIPLRGGFPRDNPCAPNRDHGQRGFSTLWPRTLVPPGLTNQFRRICTSLP